MPLLERFRRTSVRRSFVSPDLDAATRIGAEAPVSLDAPQGAVDQVWDLTRALYSSAMYPALQLCIRHRGSVVLDRAIGFARGAGPEDREEGRRVPVELDTPFQLFSASKPLAAMLVHKLDEERRVHLEDPVCEYIPEFGSKGKEQVTLRHLLSHRAGIPEVPLASVSPELLANHPRVMALLCDAEPRTRPGRRLAYHAVTAGFVIAELVRRVTGQSFRAAFDQRIRKPLRLETLRFGAGVRELAQVVHNAPTGVAPPRFLTRASQRILGLELDHAIAFSNQGSFLRAEIPSANCLGTARDVSAFYQCLLDGGAAGAARVLDARTIRRATLEQSFGEIDRSIGVPLRHSAGFMLGQPSYSPFGPRSAHAFGHVGLTNNFTWADPERELVVALLTNGQPLLGPHMARLVRWLRGISRAFPRSGPAVVLGERAAA
jgi:CubicO group peptidase (beta-lactamase class C family)